MRAERYGSWTREGKSTRYFRSWWRPGRKVLVLAGLVLILLSVGLVFLDVRRAGEETAAAPLKRDGIMKLSIPSMRHAENVPVYTAAAHNKPALRNGTLHLEGTGFPWQREANVYIAGHRLGYPRTESFLVFWDLNRLRMGRKVVLTDSEGERYIYRVYDRFVLGPDDTSATKPVAGRNVVSLQTCTLPNYTDRLIVRAELERIVQGPAPRPMSNKRS
ncbi:MAG: sortase [Rubrobacteraceae bacterium]|nr:sortase [Rubrobacteraceae bacterium]